MAALQKEPYQFDFFQAVRLLQCRFADSPRIGHSQSLQEDPIRFGQPPSLAFAPSTVAGFEIRENGRAPQLMVNFLGLFGPGGALPLCITDYARERELNHGDKTLTRFLDIFHHRMLSFFFRAWASQQKCVDADRPHRERFILYIGSLLGIGMQSLQGRDAITDWAKLYYSGRLVSQARNAEGLEQILQDYFGIPTSVQSFVGRWLPLPADSVCKLGESPRTGALGLTAIMGSRFWDCQMTFGIRLGPMDLKDYARMLPSGESFRRLRCWVLNYVGQEFFWEARLVLRANEVPPTRLGQAGQLGWTTWLRLEGKPFPRDAADLTVQVE
ncbi:MAG: type VI secretion system baseplate subunit TssG [Verrucomicrobiia bacterium]|jgi:type VI secretion system protein ImpH